MAILARPFAGRDAGGSHLRLGLLPRGSRLGRAESKLRSRRVMGRPAPGSRGSLGARHRPRLTRGRQRERRAAPRLSEFRRFVNIRPRRRRAREPGAPAPRNGKTSVTLGGTMLGCGVMYRSLPAVLLILAGAASCGGRGVEPRTEVPVVSDRRGRSGSTGSRGRRRRGSSGRGRLRPFRTRTRCRRGCRRADRLRLRRGGTAHRFYLAGPAAATSVA